MMRFAPNVACHVIDETHYSDREAETTYFLPGVPGFFTLPMPGWGSGNV